MKTNYILLYLSLSGLLMFSSCSNDDLDDMNSENTQTQISIEALQGAFNNPETQTRTMLDRWYAGDPADLGVPKGVAMQWVSTDKIGAWGTSTKYENKNYNIDLSNALTDNELAYSTSFEGSINLERREKVTISHAYFPYQQGKSVNSLPVQIDAIQNYAGKGSISPYDYKYVDFGRNKFEISKYKPCRISGVKFTQLLTLLRFVIDTEGMHDWLAAQNQFTSNLTDRVTSISISSNNNIVGQYTYNLEKVKDGLSAKEANKNLTINVTEATDEGGLQVVYAVVAPSKSNTLTLKFKYGNNEITLNTLSNIDLNAGKVYHIGLNKKSISHEGVKIEGPRKEVASSGKTDGNEFINNGPAI